MGNNASASNMMGDDGRDRDIPGAEPFVESKKIVAKPIEKAVENFYTLKEELGAGAFSTVYAGEKKDTGEMVAIKQVAKKNVPSAEDVQALLEEVGILQEIHHPHVMRIYGFYVDKKNYNLVTEMVVGGELFDRIVERKHYNEKIARDLVKIFLETLDFLHSNNIVHRDLK
jgi:serine/threonine protein kinase